MYLRTSPIVIQKHIRNVIKQLQEKKHEGSILSGLSADSLTSDERTQWRIIRKEFENSGLTLSVLESNRELILECLTAALGSAVIQPIDDWGLKEGKGKERADQLRPLIDRDRTTNPFMNSDSELFTETRIAVEEKTSGNADTGARCEEEAKPIGIIPIPDRELTRLRAKMLLNIRRSGSY